MPLSAAILVSYRPVHQLPQSCYDLLLIALSLYIGRIVLLLQQQCLCLLQRRCCWE